MVHRAIIGSFERFFGILIEHFAGKFPTWIMPTQVKIIPVSDKHLDYAGEIERKLQKEKIRADVDERNENVGYKIREAQVEEKIPYMLIVGDTEIENKTVSVRDRNGEDKGELSLSKFIKEIKKEIENKEA
jgi:threonyl-tRNA synthetase